MQMGRLPEAQHEIEEAVRLAPDDARIRANMGMILLHQDRIVKLRPYSDRRAISISALPQPHFLLGLIFALQERGLEFNEAVQGLQRIHPMLAQQLQMQAQAIRMQAIQARGAGGPRPGPRSSFGLSGSRCCKPGSSRLRPAGGVAPSSQGSLRRNQVSGPSCSDDNQLISVLLAPVAYLFPNESLHAVSSDFQSLIFLWETFSFCRHKQ